MNSVDSVDSIDMDTIKGILGCDPLDQSTLGQKYERNVLQWADEDLRNPYKDAAGYDLVDVVNFASNPRPDGMLYGGSWAAVHDFCVRFPVFLQHHDGKERPHCLRPATLNNKPYPCKGYARDDELSTKRILTQNELRKLAEHLTTARRLRRERRQQRMMNAVEAKADRT